MANILVADDEWLTRTQIDEMLTDPGYQVVDQAASGKEALEKARDLKPDLIIMDAVMPGELNGIEAAEKIKSEMDIPIVFITGYGEPEYIEQAKALAPFGYVMKPFDEQEIRGFVEIALQKRDMELRIQETQKRLEHTNEALKREIDERKKTEAALQVSQKRLRQIIDFLPDATFVIDKQGRVVVWNRAIERMTGVKAEDILGKGDLEYAIPFYGKRRPALIDLVSHWDDDTMRAYRYVRKKGEALISEAYDTLVKPGGTLWNKASLLYDEEGQVMGAIESIRDITDIRASEHALRESEEKYRALFEQSRDAIVITDTRGNIIDANRYALTLFGYKKEDMLATNFQELYVNPHDGNRFQKEMAEKGSAETFETRLRKKDGGVMDCVFSAVNRRDDQNTIIGYLRYHTGYHRIPHNAKEAYGNPKKGGGRQSGRRHRPPFQQRAYHHSGEYRTP